MKQLREYLGKNIVVQVNSKEEYEQLCPLLNTIYKGWKKSMFEDYANKGGYFYVLLDQDMMDRPGDIDLEKYSEVVHAFEFLQPKDEVVNNYPIY